MYHRHDMINGEDFGGGKREEMGEWTRQRIHIKNGRERKDNPIRRKVGEKKG